MQNKQVPAGTMLPNAHNNAFWGEGPTTNHDHQAGCNSGSCPKQTCLTAEDFC